VACSSQSGVPRLAHIIPPNEIPNRVPCGSQQNCLQ
jgi:hypothetical protein